MAAPRTERRLAAIFAADVVGYSRLMEQDEQGTLERLKVHRKEFIEPLLDEYLGRVVKLMGDGALCEFASVVDAVRCAVLIQQGMAERERDMPEAARLRFRIGINLGDVIVEAEDLYGDGVNVAARLEGLAEPGGIVVSGTVWDHLHGKLGLRFEYLGEPRLKNIERPVRAYRLVADDTVLPAVPASVPVLPAVAVLPFDNLSNDPAQAYFSDGITEDLITELSRFRHLIVLARHSSFALRDQSLGAVEIGRRLGVGYLLEGSVRKVNNRVRVTAQLIDASNGAHLWADRYDRALDDIFAVQDEVVATIAATLAGRIVAAGVERAKRKPTTDLAAYDCVLRGTERLADHGPEANAAARTFFEQAIVLDAGYALAHAFLALTIFNEEWGAAAESKLASCLELARKAVALDPTDSRCHRILAMILLSAREFERADSHSDRSVALNPNDGSAAVYRGYILIFLGRATEAVTLIQRAIALDPYHPEWYWVSMARALHGAGRHADAIAAFERIERPRFHHFARLAACHGQLGHRDEVKRLVERTLAAKPDFSCAAWVATMPYRYAADREHLLAELRAVGLPP
jgi:adenylate cyclase